MDEIAGREGEGDVDHEGGIRRPAVEIDAREMVEDHLEARGVAAEGIEQGDEAEDEEEPELAGEQAPAGHAVPEEKERRDRADEQVVRRPVGPGSLRQAVPVGTPVIVGPAQGAEDVAEQDRRQALRRQRPHGRHAEAEGGPGRGGEELHRQDDRHGQKSPAEQAHGQQQAEARLEIGEGLRRAPDPLRCERDERQSAEEGDLVAPDDHHRGAEREQHAVAVGAAVHGLFQQPEGEREEAVAEDHARVLKPGRSGAAEHEDEGGGDRARRMPAPPAEQGYEGQRAGQEMGEDDHVESLHRRLGDEPAEQQHGGGEQQGLRIRSGGVAAEMVGVPERELAAGERRAEIAQGGIELVLGIPGHHGPGQGPDGNRDRPGRQDEGKGRQRLALRPEGLGGWAVGP